MENNVVTLFNEYFYLTRADTQHLRELVYRIRFQVFCQELNYFPAERQMEQDGYDHHSEHCLLFHRPSGTPAGCMRLIGPRQDDPSCPLLFEEYCPLSPRYQINPKLLPPGSFGEISRLAVPASFRRRREDEKKPISIPEDKGPGLGNRHAFPFIPVGLFMAGMAMFLNSGLCYAFAMMEPRLVRMLSRFGIIFTQVGDVVDYHGPRAAFVLIRERALTKLQPEVYELLLLIDQQLFGASAKVWPWPSGPQQEINHDSSEGLC